MPYIDFAGNTRELRPGDTLVGSGSQAGWRLQNDGLAPRHLVLAVDAAGRATVRPHSSTTVVTLNGRRVGIDPAPLAHGDEIAAGGARLRFLERLEGGAGARRDADAPVWLVAADGAAYALDRRVVRIGRGAGSDIVLRDLGVSRTHAELRAEAGGLVLHALGSTGTQLNGRRAAVEVLEDGDVIEIAGARFTLVRGALPAGARPQALGGASDDELARRATRMMRAQDVPGAVGRPRPWVVVAVLLALAALVALVALVALAGAVLRP